MQTPLRIHAHQITLPGSAEKLIRRECEKLERHYDRIVGCHVTLESASGRHQKGSPFRVGITVEVPGRDIQISHKTHEQLEVAVRQAFEAARRQIEEYSRIRRGEVKHHVDAVPPATGETPPSSSEDATHG